MVVVPMVVLKEAVEVLDCQCKFSSLVEPEGLHFAVLRYCTGLR